MTKERKEETTCTSVHTVPQLSNNYAKCMFVHAHVWLFPGAK